MTRSLLALAVAAFAALASGCGSQGIELAKDDPLYQGAYLFQQRCAGCHHMNAVGAEGSAVKANSRERKDGPNFNTRKEDYQSVLYAIRNGGFSSGPMPQNIVIGPEAEALAQFVAENSGRDVQVGAAPQSEATDCPAP